ncbi:hypothetical protein GCM10020295_51610 [Streptomyces cinereospinus]
MLLVVVGLPGRGVVLRAVRLGDPVVQRAGRAAVAAVGLVTELDQDGEDLVRLLPAQLDVLAVALLALQLDDLGALAVGDRGLAGYDLLQRLFTLGLDGLAERSVEVVLVPLVVLRRRRVLPVGGGRRAAGPPESARATVRPEIVAVAAASATAVAAALNVQVLLVT